MTGGTEPAEAERPDAVPPEEAEYDYYDRLDQFTGLARVLPTDDLLAIDVERASGIRYSERPFLVQLRRRTGPALLLDPETPGRTVGPLVDVLGTAPLLFHAAGQDLPSLRMLGIRPRAVVDTELAGRFLGLDRVNLASMVERYLGIRLAKTHSAADWSRRPLPDSWLDYAAWDVLYLHELVDELLPRLDETGRREWFDAECAHLVQAPPPPSREEPWRRLSHVTTLRGQREFARARALWTTRDELARDRDIAPKRLLTDAAIVAAARTRPRDRDALLALDGFAGPHRSRLTGDWLAALDAADALAAGELPTVRGPRGQHPPHASWKRSEPRAADLLTRSREAVATLAEELALAPELILRPSSLRLWVWRAVTAGGGDDAALMDEVLREDDARAWQRELVREPLLTALREHRAAD